MTVASLVIPAPDSARPHRLARVLGYGVDRMPSPQYADGARYRASRVSEVASASEVPEAEIVCVVGFFSTLRAAIDACVEHAANVEEAEG